MFIPVPEIDYIESAANYVVIHSKDQSYVMRGTLANMTERLPANDFVRISRAAVVKTTFLAEVRQTGRRERQALLRNGKNPSHDTQRPRGARPHRRPQRAHAHLKIGSGRRIHKSG